MIAHYKQDYVMREILAKYQLNEYRPAPNFAGFF